MPTAHDIIWNALPTGRAPNPLYWAWNGEYATPFLTLAGLYDWLSDRQDDGRLSWYVVHDVREDRWHDAQAWADELVAESAEIAEHEAVERAVVRAA